MRHTLANGPEAGPVLDAEGAGLAQLAEGVFRRYGYDLRHFAASAPAPPPGGGHALGGGR